MTVFIDPPRWPAHGTRWSHLVSDASLDELHEFAARLPIPRRAFDVDHYDVPASDYERAIHLGAVSVEGSELVRRLIASGLRRTRAERLAIAPEQRLEFLRGEWRTLGARLDRDDSSWQALGADLLERWTESHRRYHDAAHLEDVVLALDQLAVRGERIAEPTLLAAWFHDAVYLGQPGEDERASANLAAHALEAQGLRPRLIGEVHRYILATAPGAAPERPATPLAHLLDGDLAILGAGEKRYRAYSVAVREEYAHVPDPAFRSARAAILGGILEQSRIYRTDAAAELWEHRARRNLETEIARLTAGNPSQ